MTAIIACCGSHCPSLHCVCVIICAAWLSLWRERLEKASAPWLHTWMGHQCRDQYWEHGSVCEHYDDLLCPVLLIGGRRTRDNARYG